jgi:hypothetical protein
VALQPKAFCRLMLAPRVICAETPNDR